MEFIAVGVAALGTAKTIFHVVKDVADAMNAMNTANRKLAELAQEHHEITVKNRRGIKQQLQCLTAENERLKAVYSREMERMENELLCEKQAKRKLEENTVHLKDQTEANKRQIERQKEQIVSASNELIRAIGEKLTSKEQQLQRVTTENEVLRSALRREREAKSTAIELCRRLEKENLHLKNQREADQREVDRMKEQIITYEMSKDPRRVSSRHWTEEDIGVSRLFYYIKENVTAEWKDLAYQLGFTRPDIDTIDDRNKDYKSRCLDMLGEWQKRRGKAATLNALMEALRELGLNTVVDGLRSKYQMA